MLGFFHDRHGGAGAPLEVFVANFSQGYAFVRAERLCLAVALTGSMVACGSGDAVATDAEVGGAAGVLQGNAGAPSGGTNNSGTTGTGGTGIADHPSGGMGGNEAGAAGHPSDSTGGAEGGIGNESERRPLHRLRARCSVFGNGRDERLGQRHGHLRCSLRHRTRRFRCVDFYDATNDWKVRFAPSEIGAYGYHVTVSGGRGLFSKSEFFWFSSSSSRLLFQRSKSLHK